MEGWIIAGVWIAVLSLFILLNSGIANAFVRIAKMKGHPGQKYFWWCFCTGLVGYLMVVALPDWGHADTAGDELPTL